MSLAPTSPIENSRDSLEGVSTAATGAAVSIHALEKFFVPGKPVLRGVSLEIAAGELVAVIGQSGCGKSTLLRLLAGLETATSGAIAIDGEPLRDMNPAARVMFQDARLMPWLRVLDNVALGLPAERTPHARQALREVGLEERARDWPVILSGGQRQRVALARALASEPRLLLLDEPLGALDALTRRSMQRLIEDVWQRHRFTALLVTHDVEEAVALADRIVLIAEGQIAYETQIRLPRPRDRAKPRFVQLREEILARIYEDDSHSP
jgi:sulfonate transport system ATP-binding protein